MTKMFQKVLLLAVSTRHADGLVLPREDPSPMSTVAAHSTDSASRRAATILALDGLFIFGLSLQASVVLGGNAVIIAGGLMALRYVSEMFLSPLGGRVADRYGVVRMLLLFSMLSGLALAAFCGLGHRDHGERRAAVSAFDGYTSASSRGYSGGSE